MADDTTTQDQQADEVTPVLPEVVAQEAKMVGDENFSPREPDFQVTTDAVKAQVMGSPDPPSATVPVHESYVTTDEVITDTSDPRAVQIPDAGRGDLSLPAHRLAGPTVEAYFAEHASKSD